MELCTKVFTRKSNVAFYHYRALVSIAQSTNNPGKRYCSSAASVDEIGALLSEPTWSVKSLLPSSDKLADSEVPPITPEQLRHLLRLSALPPPRDAAQESRMLQTLRSQLHFVKEIQKVDSTGVAPLQRIYDETVEASKEAEIGLDVVQDALAHEETIGRRRRIRRKRDENVKASKTCDWNVLDQAPRKIGRYFVVESGKEEQPS